MKLFGATGEVIEFEQVVSDNDDEEEFAIFQDAVVEIIVAQRSCSP